MAQVIAPRRVKGNERAGCEVRSIVIRNGSSVAGRERYSGRVCGRRNSASRAHVLILAFISRTGRPRLSIVASNPQHTVLARSPFSGVNSPFPFAISRLRLPVAEPRVAVGAEKARQCVTHPCQRSVAAQVTGAAPTMSRSRATGKHVVVDVMAPQGTRECNAAHVHPLR